VLSWPKDQNLDKIWQHLKRQKYSKTKVLLTRLATPWTYFIHLSLSSVILIDSSTESPVHVLMLSIKLKNNQKTETITKNFEN